MNIQIAKPEDIPTFPQWKETLREPDGFRNWTARLSSYVLDIVNLIPESALPELAKAREALCSFYGDMPYELAIITPNTKNKPGHIEIIGRYKTLADAKMQAINFAKIKND